MLERGFPTPAPPCRISNKKKALNDLSRLTCHPLPAVQAAEPMTVQGEGVPSLKCSALKDPGEHSAGEGRQTPSSCFKYGKYTPLHASPRRWSPFPVVQFGIEDPDPGDEFLLVDDAAPVFEHEGQEFPFIQPRVRGQFPEFAKSVFCHRDIRSARQAQAFGHWLLRLVGAGRIRPVPTTMPFRSWPRREP